MTEPVKIGVIGCGTISGTYFEASRRFGILEIVGCADQIEDRARARAAEYSIPKVYSVEALLGDPDIEIVVNLTVPRAHAAIGISALEAGKSVYNEKPLAPFRAEGRQMLEIAHARQLLVGCAPDTFLGGGLQTCRKLIDAGAIGVPIGATAFMMSHGPESWHPDPEFFYKVGSGPLFDMGPYYLTALLLLLGPVRRVTGSARISVPERTITSQPKFGTTMAVEVPTYVAAVLDFAKGAIATLITSFDVWAAELPRIEIYGTEGTLSVPDPNTFDGPVRIRRAGAETWSTVPLTHGYTHNYRSIGVADMAYALRSGRPHRANGELAFHVLDIMHAIHESAHEGCHIELTSTCEQPSPLPTGLVEGTLDP